jgi:hypothetical protein
LLAQAPASAEFVANQPTESAQTADQQSPPAVTLDGQLGLGTPIGALGAWVGYRALPILSFALGAGLEESDGQPQVAAMVRVHTSGRSRIGGAFGPSFGNFVHDKINIAHPESNRTQWIDNTLWLNAHFFYEHEALSGFRVGVLQGFAVLAGPRDAQCAVNYRGSPADPCEAPRLFLYVGVSFGWAFGLD